MRRRIIALIITLAIIGPGIIAGTWVAYYVAQHKHAAPASYLHGWPPSYLYVRTAGKTQPLSLSWLGTEPAPLPRSPGAANARDTR